jgi:hypothetical protein
MFHSSERSIYSQVVYYGHKQFACGYKLTVLDVMLSMLKVLSTWMSDWSYTVMTLHVHEI